MSKKNYPRVVGRRRFPVKLTQRERVPVTRDSLDILRALGTHAFVTGLWAAALVGLMVVGGG